MQTSMMIIEKGGSTKILVKLSLRCYGISFSHMQYLPTFAVLIKYMSRFTAIFGLFLGILLTSEVKAQSYFTSLEVGVAIGGSQYFGDLNDNYGFKTIGLAGGIYARKHMNQYISVKLVANYTKVGYDDKYNTEPFEHQRNLNFQSVVVEGALQAEFNFFRFVTGDKEHRFTPFLTGGIGAFYYDPYTYLNGQKYNLRSQGTEGQNNGYADRKYTSISPCFPIGVGVKWWLKGGVNLTLEVADRLTTTDYLDDVSATYVGANRFPANSPAAALQDRSGEQSSGSNGEVGRAGKQRGNTASKDQYLMALASISWHFTTYRCPHFMSDDLIKVRR